MRLRRVWLAEVLAVCAAAPAIGLSRPSESPNDSGYKIERGLMRRLQAGGTAEFLVVLSRQADLAGADQLADRVEKRRFVSESLRAIAAETQGPVRALLSGRGAEYRPFWIANMVLVRGDLPLARSLAARGDVSRLDPNPIVHLSDPLKSAAGKTPASAQIVQTIEWNVSKVHAPDLWALGFHGEGVVVAGGDTGYEWQHPALEGKYRGWNGTTADHNYNWHDAIHSGGGICGPDSPVPCDDYGHGTHTMGTMVGDDGAGNQIGLAPGAKWIGCRNMDQGNGTPARYAECFQFFLAPTDLSGNNPDPSKAPDVINNSWTCPPSEGCTDPNVLETVVEYVRAAGIVVVASAGNAGPSCSTVEDPPAIYEAALSVGATDSTDTIASFSSRGPVTSDGSGRMKPDVSAPGVSVRSSVPGDTYAIYSGTSMAGPHVAGAVALLQSAFPSFNGDPTAFESQIERSAVALTTTQTCGVIPGTQVPNNTYGWGRLDVLAAYTRGSGPDLAVTASFSPASPEPGLPMQYAIVARSTSFATSSTSVTLTGTLPAGLSFGTVSTTRGSCNLVGTALSCSLGTLAPGSSATILVPATPPAPGSFPISVQVSGAETEADTTNNTAALTAVVDFGDVPPSHPFHNFVGRIARAGVTVGCGNGLYCPDSPVTRAQIAVFLLRGNDGASYVPPPATGTIFSDVPAGSFAAAWIEQLSARAITAGCGPGLYCPAAAVTRAQVAVFLLRTRLGSSYTPPPASGLFADLPASDPFARWAEDLYARGLTAGCGTSPLRFCPSSPVTRGQMSVFVATTFGLP